VKYVEQNINSIGYGGMGYTGKVKHKIDGVEPKQMLEMILINYQVLTFFHKITWR
jgi:hypothetical protein